MILPNGIEIAAPIHGDVRDPLMIAGSGGIDLNAVLPDVACGPVGETDVGDGVVTLPVVLPHGIDVAGAVAGGAGGALLPFAGVYGLWFLCGCSIV
jgi:hypothetical protein